MILVELKIIVENQKYTGITNSQLLITWIVKQTPKSLLYLQLGRFNENGIGFCKINAEGVKKLAEALQENETLLGLFFGIFIE